MRSSDHGTSKGYQTYKCRCDVCRRWNTDKAIREQIARQSRPIPDEIHGTKNGYDNYRCRCDKCRAAMTAYRRDLVQRTKSAAVTK